MLQIIRSMLDPYRLTGTNALTTRRKNSAEAVDRAVVVCLLRWMNNPLIHVSWVSFHTTLDPYNRVLPSLGLVSKVLTFVCIKQILLEKAGGEAGLKTLLAAIVLSLIINISVSKNGPNSARWKGSRVKLTTKISSWGVLIMGRFNLFWHRFISSACNWLLAALFVVVDSRCLPPEKGQIVHEYSIVDNLEPDGRANI